MTRKTKTSSTKVQAKGRGGVMMKKGGVTEMQKKAIGGDILAMLGNKYLGDYGGGAIGQALGDAGQKYLGFKHGGQIPVVQKRGVGGQILGGLGNILMPGLGGALGNVAGNALGSIFGFRKGGRVPVNRPTVF